MSFRFHGVRYVRRSDGKDDRKLIFEGKKRICDRKFELRYSCVAPNRIEMTSTALRVLTSPAGQNEMGDIPRELEADGPVGTFKDNNNNNKKQQTALYVCSRTLFQARIGVCFIQGLECTSTTNKHSPPNNMWCVVSRLRNTTPRLLNTSTHSLAS